MILSRVSALSLPEWLPDELRSRVDGWNSELARLQSVEVEIRRLRDEVTERPTVQGIEKLQRRALDFLTKAKNLLAEYRQLAGECEQARRREYDRLRSELDVVVRENVQKVADVLGLTVPGRDTDPLYAALAEPARLAPNAEAIRTQLEELRTLADEYARAPALISPIIERELEGAIARFIPTAVSSV